MSPFKQIKTNQHVFSLSFDEQVFFNQQIFQQFGTYLSTLDVDDMFILKLCVSILLILIELRKIV